MSESVSYNLVFSLSLPIILGTIELEDGLRLRLVNRLFNEEILRLYCVIGVQRNEVNGLASKEWVRYRLQATLSMGYLRSVFDKPALDSFREAIALLWQMPSWLRYTTELEECSGEPNNHGHWLHDRASIAVCEAVVYHHGPVPVSEMISDYFPTDSMLNLPYFETVDPRFWVFTATCTIGNAALVHETIEALRQPKPGAGITKDELANYLTRGLYIPAILGHTNVLQLLLDLGADLNFVGNRGVSKDKTALLLATLKGKTSVVELLLQPKYRLQCTGLKYEEAIVNAASFPDVEVRRKLVPLLLTRGHDFRQPELRSSLFNAACIVDDIGLANSILADGPVRMFDAFPRPGWGDNALATAVANGHRASVQLILRSNFTSVPPEVQDNGYWTALRAASQANSIAIFNDILPYIDQRHSNGAFILAAAVEGGTSAMEILLPRIDLKDLDLGRVVGEAALGQALVQLRPENVRFLLQQGLRVKHKILISRKDYKRAIDAFHVIQDLLRAHQRPPLEIRSA